MFYQGKNTSSNAYVDTIGKSSTVLVTEIFPLFFKCIYIYIDLKIFYSHIKFF